MAFRKFIVSTCVFIAAALPGHSSHAADVAFVGWQKAITESAFIKDGLKAMGQPQYEYECLGLGGTVLRAGTDGLTGLAAPGVTTNGYLKHVPFLSYQYWWDDEAHRHIPFQLRGGYGPKSEPGTVASFRHELDISSGLLLIDLGLDRKSTGGMVEPGGTNLFQSHREISVTPRGVLVIRVQDSQSADLPFELDLSESPKVRIYLNQGSYEKPHDPWTTHCVPRTNGFVLVANRPNSCVATLAVAVEGQDTFADAKTMRAGSLKPGKAVTFYIAPGSSYEGSDPVETAWKKACTTRDSGYGQSRRDTLQWWQNFYARSGVNLPDHDLARWYARSAYYMGVFFGNTDVPPGCNGTSVESFSGAVCPEYDLVIDQQALLYGNHFDEARRVVDWLGRAMPKAESYATNGLKLQKTSVKYQAGAKFGPLMGFDGTILQPPTEGEGVWAHEDFAGNNAAFIACQYVDWTGDLRSEKLAELILKETTEISMEDLRWNADGKNFLNKNMPSMVQQAGTRYGLKESMRRGVAEADWKNKLDNVWLPTGSYDGKSVLIVGPGGNPEADTGDATWLSAVWWYPLIPTSDSRVANSYELFRNSKTGDYVFNNGWMGVIAAKLGNGGDALQWAKRFLKPGVTVFDDSCFGELVADFEDFKKTPEVAAHASLLCNINQMLLDPDDDSVIKICPALPDSWRQKGVAFERLAARGGILVSCSWTQRDIHVVLENTSGQVLRRTLRVRMPPGVRQLQHPTPGGILENNWAIQKDIRILPGRKMIFTFQPG